jgi:GNAT superfamily N-acetyltransferase
LTDREIEETEFFVEKEDENGFITYRLYANDANVCTAAIFGRGNLQKIHSNPKGAGFGTKMLGYFEKKALEKGLTKVTVSAIADDERVRHFFEKNGYKLTPDPQCSGESEGEKILKQ